MPYLPSSRSSLPPSNSVRIWLWRTSPSDNNWPSPSADVHGLNSGFLTVSSGAGFPRFGAHGARLSCSSNRRPSSIGIGTGSNVSGPGSRDEKSLAVHQSRTKSGPESGRWRGPPHGGERRGFTANYSSSGSRSRKGRSQGGCPRKESLLHKLGARFSATTSRIDLD